MSLKTIVSLTGQGDDLFDRSLLGCTGAVLVLVAYLFRHLAIDASASMSSAWRVVIALLLIAMAGWGFLLIAGALAGPQSKWRRFAWAVVPDRGGKEGIALAVLVFIPAYLVTALLRSLGVRGSPDVTQSCIQERSLPK